MENKLEKLIGAQLVSLDNNSMVLNLKGDKKINEICVW